MKHSKKIEINIIDDDDDIMDFMDDFGFEYKFSVGEHYDKNNVNCQSDLVFINKNIK